MEAYRGAEVQIHSFLTSVQDEGEQATSCPLCSNWDKSLIMTNICNSLKFESDHNLHIPKKKKSFYVFLVFVNGCWAISGR